MSESNRQDESQQSTKEEDSKKKTKKDNIEDLIELIIKDEKTAEDNEKIKQDVKELLKESEQLTATAANNGQKWAFFLMVSYQLKRSDRKELIELGISLVEDARNIENEGNSFKEIKQIVTPSGLENLSKTWQMNLLELSLMV
ncbi:uncharacterized protein LOC114574637 [Exaiptasia diaphana]|uniref:Uncharacterized protein n=1 Tax=Exaiptasia diaphana TaxID=2652724 RepID=A0A913YGG1_EXADI|nr:uncharacterized protein LOC114574637 [Exaiptasia diaphana]